MDLSKFLIILPVAILLTFGILAMTGLGTNTIDLQTNGNFSLNYIGTAAETGNIDFKLYDYGGNEKCYINGTATNEEGSLTELFLASPPSVAAWTNTTGSYQVYYDQEHFCPVLWSERNFDNIFIPNTGRMDQAGSGVFNLASSLGFIALISVIMAIGSIVGIRILDSGESEFSVRLLVIGIATLTFWGILTFMAYPLIYEGGFYVYIPYFLMTASYCLGIVFEVSN